MLDLKSQIVAIENLLQENTIQSLTYAALECRLTIESICYDRLKISYDYLSYDDLRKWQPRDVVRQVVAEANEMADQEFSFAIAPNDPDKEPPVTVEDYESLEFTEFGKQSKINANKLGRLWNALSNVALHVMLPKSKEDEITIYGNKEKIEKKVQSALNEFKEISEGNLIMGGAGKSSLAYSFNCVTCNSIIKKNVGLLKEVQVVNCISPDCWESYVIEKNGSDIEHSRNKEDLTCQKCETINHIPHKWLSKFTFGQTLTVTCCDCKYENEITLKPYIKKLTKEKPSE